MDLIQSLAPLWALLFSLATWLVRHFASPGVSILIQALVVLSFGLGFGGVALLPIDLSLTVSIDEGAAADGGSDADDGDAAADDVEGEGDVTMATATSDEDFSEVNATYVPWLVTYWSTFLLAWTVLPLVRQTLLSGHFTLSSRLRYGCRRVVRALAIMLCLAVAGILALAAKLGTWHIIPVVMALGNTYGLLLVSLLLGYGLVDVPRKLWRNANPELELRRAQIMAGAADEALFDAVWKLQDREESIDKAVSAIENSDKGHISSDSPDDVYYAQCVDDLIKKREETANLSPELQRRRTAGSQRRHSNSGDDGEGNREEGGEVQNGERPSLDELARLGAKLKLAQAQLVSAEQRWNALVERSQFYGELKEGGSPPGHLGVAASAPLLSRANAQLSIVGQYGRYVWRRWLRSPMYRFLGMFTAGLSVMVLWSEATLAAPVNLNPFVLFLGATDREEGNGLLFQIAALVPLLYMSWCMFGSLFKLSVFGPFCLRGSKQSLGVALVFNAQYLVRLQFPLGYNYLLMLKYDTSSTTCAFSKVMSDMETVPFFGTSFSVYAPLLILALCGFTLCNGYARLLSLLGIEHEDAILMGDKETLDGKVNEGIQLLRRHVERSGGAGGGRSESGSLGASGRGRSRSGSRASSSLERGASFSNEMV
mmetsp:Transcript_31940/g.95639  ORF Transcript_31940/g.95639 Transcript_31940/m.95639 type:complete len:655 (-) Transcript_31940:140-2104(-)